MKKPSEITVALLQCRDFSKEDAEFIFRAIASHKKLIEIAERDHNAIEFEYDMPNDRHIASKCDDCMFLAKARGKS